MSNAFAYDFRTVCTVDAFAGRFADYEPGKEAAASLFSAFPYVPAGSSGMPKPGADFVRAAEYLAGNHPGPAGELLPASFWIEWLYYRALYDDELAISVTHRGVAQEARIVPGGLWGDIKDYYNCLRAGPCPAKIMVVSKMPGEDEARRKRTLCGPSGDLLRKAVRAAGVEGDDWYVCNMVRFKHLDPRGGELARQWIEDCLPVLHQELLLVRPDFILLLGKDPIPRFLGRNVSLRSTAGRVFEYRLPLPDGTDHVCKVMACNHSDYVLKRPEAEGALFHAVSQFVGLTRGIDPAQPAPADHVAVRSSIELANLARVILGDPSNRTIAVDAEWHGDYPTEPGAYLRTIQISWKSGKAAVIVLRGPGGMPAFAGPTGVMDPNAALPYLKLILKGGNLPDWSPRVCGHNLSADLPWFVHYGLDLRAEFDVGDGTGGMDTMLAAHAVEETADFELETLAGRLLGTHRYDVKLNEWKKAYCKENKLDSDDLGGYGMVPEDILIGVPVGETGPTGMPVADSYGCLHRDSLVGLADGAWEKIGKIVHSRSPVLVKSVESGRIVEAVVTGWHRHAVGQKEWFKIRTDSTPLGRWGPLGPSFTPDHEVLTQRGKVRVDSLVPGEDLLVTDDLSFTDSQISVIAGCILGDGGFSRKNNVLSGFHFSQLRAGYSAWKAAALGSHSPVPWINGTRNGHTGFQLPFSRPVAALAARFPVHPPERHAARKALITEDLLSALGDLGLAVWYQDDGTLVSESSCRIYATISSEEADLALGWLRDRLGCDVRYNDNGGRPGNRFFLISRDSFDSFHQSINRFMCPAMAYKTPLPVSGGYLPDQGTELFLDPVVSVERYHPSPGRRGHGVRYCLSVASTGNFLTKAGFVSNCMDADSTRQLVDYYDGVDGKPGALDRDIYGQSSRRPYVISRRAQPAFLEMHMTGIQVDVDRAGGLSDTYLEVSNRVLSDLRNRIAWPDFNPSSVFQCRELLYGPELNGKVNKATGGTVSVRPEGAATLGLPPYKTSGKRSKLWAALGANQHLYDPSTDKEALAALANRPDCPEVVNLLRDYRLIGALLRYVLRPARGVSVGTPERDEVGNLVYDRGMLSYVQIDSRVRSQYYSTKETGRASSARPALQNVGKRKEPLYKRILEQHVTDRSYSPIRSVLRSAAGTVLVSADWIGAEMMGMAIQARDPAMLDHCSRSQLPEDDPRHYDILSAVAIEAFQIKSPDGSSPAPSKAGLRAVSRLKSRDAAKIVAYGRAYGMEPATALRRAREEGTSMTLHDAEALFYGLDMLYPGLPELFAACRARVHNPGYIVNAFGRLRRAPASTDRQTVAEQERQFMNFLIQSLVADAMSTAMSNLPAYRRYHGRPGSDDRWFNTVLQVHDQLVLEVPIPSVDWVVNNVLPTCMVKGVSLYSCDLDGNVVDATPYHLSIETDVEERWGVPLTLDRCRSLGVSETYAK